MWKGSQGQGLIGINARSESPRILLDDKVGQPSSVCIEVAEAYP